jgi:predicted TIM-barrel fold metal-dependent hydrolase
MSDKPRIITIEEHYWDRELAAKYQGTEAFRDYDILERLYDVGPVRLAAMDEVGIDMQVVSHGAPSTQKLPADQAAEVARGVNDRLAAMVAANPSRFKAFAALPTPDPLAAAKELDRCVTQHGFVGAMIHGLTNQEFPDLEKFWPIFERAEALDVPIYLHPAVPHPAVMDAYYKEYMKEYPMVIRAAWGFTVETATIAIRIVLSGMLQKFPRLKLVLGHMGETLPFLMTRINEALSRPGNKSMSFRDAFSQHFWITTSGNFSTPALICSMLEIGIDRIIFSVDYPFVPNPPGVDWILAAPLSNEDRAKVLHGNAEKLLKI